MLAFVLSLTLAAIFFIVPWRTTARHALHRFTGEGVALTIDDGPYPSSTPALLEALAAAEISATFFCVGARLRQEPALGAAIIASGHVLANHSDIHAYSMALLPRSRSQADIESAARTIASYGPPPPYFRAVAGVLSPPLLAATRASGLTPIGWTASARDGGPLPVSTARALQRLMPGIVHGGILVIHDRPQAAGLIAALSALVKETGLHFSALPLPPPMPRPKS